MNEVNVSADCADKRKADGKLNNKGFSLVEMLDCPDYRRYSTVSSGCSYTQFGA